MQFFDIATPREVPQAQLVEGVACETAVMKGIPHHVVESLQVAQQGAARLKEAKRQRVARAMDGLAYYSELDRQRARIRDREAREADEEGRPAARRAQAKQSRARNRRQQHRENNQDEQRMTQREATPEQGKAKGRDSTVRERT